MEKRAIVVLIAITLMVAAALGWHNHVLQKGFEASPEPAAPTTETVSMCGKEFEMDIVLKNGTDVARRIAELETEAYEKGADKTATQCQSMKDLVSGSRIHVHLKETVGRDKPLVGTFVYEVSIDGVVYIIDRKTGYVYATNAVDTSPARVIGVFAAR